MNAHQFGAVDNDTVLYVSNSYIMKIMFDREIAVEFPMTSCESARILQCSHKFAILVIDGVLYVLDHNATQTIRTSGYSMSLPVFVAQDFVLQRLSQASTHGHLWNRDTGALDAIDLSSMRHNDTASAPVLSSVQGLFEYVRVSNGNIYGLCRLLDGTYVVIKIINDLVVRIANHCGPTDICPFETTGMLIESYKNQPVVRNSERVFVLETTGTGVSASSRTFPTEGLSVQITGPSNDKLIFCKRGAWMYVSSTGPKRANLPPGHQILAMTDTRVIVRTPTGVHERAFSSVFDDVTSSSISANEDLVRSRPLRHFMVTTCVKGGANVARVIENIRTRSSETHMVEINPHTCIVSTGVRFDSFQTSLRSAFANHGGGMVMYHDFVLTEFPSAELAEMFSRRLWS
jgi:hypothetical protein